MSTRIAPLLSLTILKGLHHFLKILSCLTLVYALCKFFIWPEAINGTNKFPVDVPIRISYSLPSSKRYWATPPPKAPLEPPPEITKARLGTLLSILIW